MQNKKETKKPSTLSAVQTREKQSTRIITDRVCFFCDKPAGLFGDLHEVSTKEVDWKVRKCALALEDTELIAKLAPADMIALEAKYHTQCLLRLYDNAKEAGDRLGEPANHLRVHIRLA